uniref:Uncharacterized protein n=1 Tax=Ditylum brightwellii TaxID=49249 RepID=A0A7S4RLG2_9STRA
MLCTSSSFLSCFTFSNLLICFSHTKVLSICNTFCISSLSSSSVSLPSRSLYLFTPTITSSPESMQHCFFVAHSLMQSFSDPESICHVIPPLSSTSSMISIALEQISSVKDSII